ncbi:23S rRNA (uracil(1939)-C(5))-methyltransferase RlmD [Candidatus Gracilibacteria bacterium]|nr:23S rRNA (uracil(1939)-C(5))-methyltransferase RlmD [Candidatus Gracilibacteria bacterium]
MKKHDIIENIKIEKLIFGGSGLATASDGRKIIISGGAIPDGIVDLRITKSKKNHLEAQIYRTVKKSPLEKAIPAEWQLYGGCKWLPIPYDKQLEIKEQQITEAFHSLKGETEQTDWHTIIRSPDSEHYRNKVEFSWGKYISEREGMHDDYRFGFHVQGQFDRIEDCWYCVLADELTNQVFRDIDIYARGSDLPTYDPKTGIGFWRHLVVRRAKKTGEMMLIFSVNGTWDTEKVGITGTREQFFTNMVRELSEKYREIASVYYLENMSRADVVQGNQVLLYGAATITDELLGLTFEIQPKSFFQVNTLGAEKLYGRVIDSIQYKRGVLLDLYAGTGTIGILLAKYFSKVYSVELVSSSSEDGVKNADRNSVTNVEFINAKVEDFAKQFASEKGKADTIILDPPRDGLHASAIPHILAFGAREIIYVSCNPATLVRDISIMLGRDMSHQTTDTNATEMIADQAHQDKKETKTTLPLYRISDITPMDMFPHTHHIETVVRLERV